MRTLRGRSSTPGGRVPGPALPLHLGLDGELQAEVRDPRDATPVVVSIPSRPGEAFTITSGPSRLSSMSARHVQAQDSAARTAARSNPPASGRLSAPPRWMLERNSFGLAALAATTAADDEGPMSSRGTPTSAGR